MINNLIRMARNALPTLWWGIMNIPYMCERYGWHKTFLPGRAVDKNGEPIPWFSYPCIEWLKSQDWSNKHVHEWGAGYGTLWWSKRAASVISREDNPAFISNPAPHWVQALRDQLPPHARVTFRAGKQDYVRGTSADVYVVDGSHRLECCEWIAKNAPVGTIAICDNVNHMRYTGPLQNKDWICTEFTGPVPGWPFMDSTAVFERVS